MLYIKNEDYDYFDRLFNSLDHDRSYAFLDLLLKAGSEKKGTDVFVITLRHKELTGDGEIVFRTKSGRPFDHDDVTKRIWYPTLLKAGLAPRSPYQSRHTAASMWLASGENPEWVARQLGHANTEMLFKVYSKFIPNLTRRDGSAFEKFIGEKLKAEHSERALMEREDIHYEEKTFH